MNYKLVDVYLVAFFLFLGTYQAYKLANADYSIILREKKESIATLANLISTVKVKGGQDIAWSNAKEGSGLAFNDQVYTHEKSLAKLNFDDGNEVSLFENTLFKIVQKGDGKELELEKGMLHTKLSTKGKGFKIKVGSEIMEVKTKGAEIQVSKKGKSSRVSVVKGNVDLVINKKSVKLSKSQTLFKDDSGKMEVLTAEISLLSPQSNEKIYFIDKKDIEFTFSLNKKIEELKLTLAHDFSFTDIVEEISLDSHKGIVTFDEEGSYFWKVKGVDREKNIESDIYHLFLLKEKALKMYAPLDEEEFVQKEKIEKNEAELLQVYLKWEKASSNSYHLQVIKDDEEKVFDQKVFSPIYILKDPPSGHYKWRVKIQDKLRPESLWSDWRSFDVKMLKLAPPPLWTDNVKEVTLNFYDKDDAYVDLEWEEAEDVGSYELFFVEMGMNKKIVKKVEVNDNEYRFYFKNSGEYQFTLKSKDKFGRKTKLGEKKIIHVNFEDYKEDRPQEGTKIVLKKPNQKVVFEWAKEKKEDDLEIFYLFELSREKDFKEILQSKKTKDKNLKVVLPGTGVFYWRTKTVDLDNKVHYSRPKKVEVSPSPPPCKPEIPKKLDIEIKVRSFKDKKRVTLWYEKIFDFFVTSVFAEDNAYERYAIIEWEKNEDAKSYIVEIYEKEGENLILKETLSDNKLEWKNPPAGEYRWRMAIIDFWDRLGPFSEYSFLSISLPEELKPLEETELISPAHGEVLKVSSDKRNYLFRWEQDERVKEGLLVFSRDLSFSQKSIIYQEKFIDDNELDVDLFKLNRLGSDWIYFRVVSKAPYLKDSLSLRRKIKILKEEEKEKKKTLKEEKVLTEKVKESHSEKETNFLQLGMNYGYRTIEYEQKAGINTIIIDGRTDLNSGFWGHLLTANYDFGGALIRKQGEVFAGEKFSETDLEFWSGYTFWKQRKIYGVGRLGAGAFERISYKVSGNKVLKNENKFLFSLIPGFTFFYFPQNNQQIIFSLDYAIGSYQEGRGKILYGHRFLKKWFVHLGLSYQQAKYKISGSELQDSEIGGMIGISTFQLFY